MKLRVEKVVSNFGFIVMIWRGPVLHSMDGLNGRRHDDAYIDYGHDVM